MITRLAGGRVIDPADARSSGVRDIHFEDGRIIDLPPGRGPDQTIDLAGATVMAGAIDIHSHIAGGKVNLARLLMTADHRHTAACGHVTRAGSGHATPTCFTTGYRYGAMGYTAAFEPAMVPANARAAHLEMADIPIVDRGAYVMLGNDELLLRLLASGTEQERINDYVAWMMRATAALGVKTVNPAGISAFKFNRRGLDLEEPGPWHEVTPRQVIRALARAVHEIGVPHPLHVHCNNLGVPGNVETTLATIAAAEGYKLHLTHIQFHSYGTEGDRHFSSAAARVAEAVNRNPNVSIDVGQIVFGPTVTASGDTMAQYRNRVFADPDKWVSMDIECDGGCGIVPFRYRDKNFVNALQWAIGLELFLLVDDPWRIFLTTDHPNGGPFASYPQLVRLLCDRAYRNDCLAQIHPAARKASVLGSLAREYSLEEIAVMTRAAPARILGLADHGHLGAGAAADIVVYDTNAADAEARFASPLRAFKAGTEIARAGEIVATPAGRTHLVRPDYDPAIEHEIRDFFDRYMTVGYDQFPLTETELNDAGADLVVQPCRPRVRT